MAYENVQNKKTVILPRKKPRKTKSKKATLPSHLWQRSGGKKNGSVRLSGNQTNP